MSEDADVRQLLSLLLKDGLKEQLDEEAQLDDLYEQMGDFKARMRGEMQAIYKELDDQEDLASRVSSILAERYPDCTIEEWTAEDQEGFVYGWPENVEIQTLQANEPVMLFTLSFLDKSELALLLRLRRFYEQYSGTTGVKVICFSAIIDSTMREVAEQNNVEIVAVPRTKSS